MTEPLCIRCARPLADGSYVCERCAAQTAQKLAEIAEVAPAARGMANGLSRSSQCGATGKPGSRLPLDLTAMAKLDGVENSLTGWARHIAEERGLNLDTLRPIGDQVPWLARWLVGGIEWMRHRPEADEFLTDVEACRRIVRGIVRGPAEQRYLGPCGAPISEIDQLVDAYGEDPAVGLVARYCDGDVYVRGDARTGRCKICEAEVDRGDREAWLSGEVRGWAFRASEIAEAYKVNVDTIRSWAFRGRLKSYWRTETGIVAPWNDVAAGAKAERLHYVGDVLDLAAADAARRETNRAERARRTAARAAESEQVA